MNFLEDFKKEFPNGERKIFSPEDRLKTLQIDQRDQKRIEELEFGKIDVNNEEYSNTAFAVISVSKIAGINRQDNVKNWIECLFGLHKQRNFELFPGREKYEKFLMSGDKDSEDLPHVVEHGGKYYVSENGKHRITFAKCLGIENISVFVSRKMPP